MTDAIEGRRPGSGDSRARGVSIIEDRQLLAKMIPRALGLLMHTIEECRYLLQSARSSPSGSMVSAVPEYGKGLPARERRILDQAVNDYAADLEKALSRKFAESEDEDDRGNDDHPIYPFSAETENVLFEIVSSEINRELVAKHFSKYFDDLISGEYIAAKIRLGPDVSREVIQGIALLPLIISKAEEFLGAIVRTGLSLYPQALGEPPSVPNDILVKYQQNISSSDVKRWQIDHQVAQLLKGSPDEWAMALNRWTKIDITQVGADWDMLNEMIQRRHAVIHNGGRADADYLARISPALRRGLYPGSDLRCNSTYMKPALVELETWATCAALRFSKHFFKEDKSIYIGVLQAVTRLQSLGRWTQGLAIMDSFLLEPIPLDPEDVILAQINRWFCLQELGKDNDSIQREIRNWRADKSMSPREADYLEIGRLALLRDYDGLLAALNRYFIEGDIQKRKRGVGEMPLIQRAIRESAKVKSYFRGGQSSKHVHRSTPHGRRNSSRRR
jgi:hypothetical protein